MNMRTDDRTKLSEERSEEPSILWISDLEGERGSIAEKFFGARGGSGQFSRTTDPFEGLLGIPSRRDKSGTVDLVRRLLLTSSFLLYLNFNGL